MEVYNIILCIINNFMNKCAPKGSKKEFEPQLSPNFTKTQFIETPFSINMHVIVTLHYLNGRSISTIVCVATIASFPPVAQATQPLPNLNMLILILISKGLD